MAIQFSQYNIAKIYLEMTQTKVKAYQSRKDYKTLMPYRRVLTLIDETCIFLLKSLNGIICFIVIFGPFKTPNYTQFAINYMYFFLL